jgi:hypothetical protein
MPALLFRRLVLIGTVFALMCSKAFATSTDYDGIWKIRLSCSENSYNWPIPHFRRKLFKYRIWERTIYFSKQAGQTREEVWVLDAEWSDRKNKNLLVSVQTPTGPSRIRSGGSVRWRITFITHRSNERYKCISNL